MYVADIRVEQRTRTLRFNKIVTHYFCNGVDLVCAGPGPPPEKKLALKLKEE